MNFEFSEEACRSCKDVLARSGPSAEIWRDKYSQRHAIGYCMYLVEKLKPTDPADFYQKYIEYAVANPDKTVYWRGLTPDELNTLVENYRNDAIANGGLNGSFELYYNDALCHIIVETYDGLLREMDIKNALSEHGFHCDMSRENIDADYGVDVLFTHDHYSWYGLQVKPVTFYLGRRGDIVSDKVKLCEKYEKTLREKRIYTYYAFYEGSKWYRKLSDGKFLFNIDELFEYDRDNITKETLKEKMSPQSFIMATKLTSIN